mgnify:CR=1 FL=1
MTGTWIAIGVLALITFGMGLLIAREGRQVWTLLASALVFALAGYAWQGSPGLPGSPRQAVDTAMPASDALIEGSGVGVQNSDVFIRWRATNASAMRCETAIWTFCCDMFGSGSLPGASSLMRLLHRLLRAANTEALASRLATSSTSRSRIWRSIAFLAHWRVQQQHRQAPARGRHTYRCDLNLGKMVPWR